jgi:hypothetical protein
LPVTGLLQLKEACTLSFPRVQRSFASASVLRTNSAIALAIVPAVDVVVALMTRLAAQSLLAAPVGRRNW